MIERITPLLKLPQAIFAPRADADKAKRKARPRLKGGWALATATAIAFSLTFFVGGLALLSGVIPASIAKLPAPIDLPVLVLMVPLCALTLMIIAEVLRAAISGVPRVQPPRLVAALSDWRPGQGEG